LRVAGEDLADLDSVFADIEDFLNPKPVNTQLNFHLLSGFFSRRRPVT
jgi:hypothetical protein